VQHRHKLGEYWMVTDGMRGLAHRQRVLDVTLPPGGAHQDGGGAQAPDRTDGDDELGPRRGHKGDATAGTDAAGGQRGGESARQSVQSGLGVRLFLEDEDRHGRLPSRPWKLYSHLTRILIP